MRLITGAAMAVVAALALAGCSAGPAEDDGRLSIVASTNVYGSIAQAVGGDAVTVTSLIDSAAQDPHSYEASARDRLAISRADVVVGNGGGYDPFVGQLIGDSSARVVTAVESVHEDHDGHDHNNSEGLNEHVWYDLHAMAELAEELAAVLGELDAGGAAAYTGNAEAFALEIEVLHERAHALEERLDGKGVAVTEPVPLYLLEAVGLVNLTPDAFTQAIEEGSDVPPTALQQTLAVIASGDVVLLAYNSQTASAETQRVRAAAEAAGIPVVDFSETLPDGEDYLSWMTANLEVIESTLL